MVTKRFTVGKVKLRRWESLGECRVGKKTVSPDGQAERRELVRWMAGGLDTKHLVQMKTWTQVMT